MEGTRFTREILLKRVLGDEELVDEIFAMVLADVPGIILELRNHLDSGDIVQAKGTAHRLKGLGGNVGAMRLFNLAAEIEQRCKAESSEGIPSLLDEIEKEFEEMRPELMKTKPSVLPDP